MGGWNRIIESDRVSQLYVKGSKKFTKWDESYITKGEGMYFYQDTFEEHSTHPNVGVNFDDWCGPSANWYQILSFQLFNDSPSYFNELAFGVNDFQLYHRQKRGNGSYFGWSVILDSDNYSTYCVNKYASSSLSDRIQIFRNGADSSWLNGRDNAMIRTVSQPNNTSYCPFFSIKTVNGSWDLGPYGEDALHLSFISDIDYANGNNNQTRDYQFTIDGNIDRYSVRNIAAGTWDMASGSTPLTTGNIYYVYE